MYFIVAYYGCVGLIAALGEAGSISMRDTKPKFATEITERILIRTLNW